MKNTRYSIFLLAPILAMVACQQKSPDGKVLDTPTSGQVKIMVDEGYRPVIASAVDVFDSIYRLAHIEGLYVPEADAVKALLDDSIQVIIIPRPLKQEELDFFKSKGIVPKQNLVAYDAVAFLIHPSNKDSVFTEEQLKGILSGNIKTWKQMNPQSPLGNITLVFDNANSSTVRYCRDSIIAGAPISAAASALQSNQEVIKYVSEQKGAIGIIGANWVSDSDDKGVQSVLQSVVMADIAPEAGKEGFGPYQAYIATKKYPYRRPMHIINCQGRAGLGLGFASFLVSDPGQRIMMKDGLLAANVPIRVMQVLKE